jgi:hypothetical protein
MNNYKSEFIPLMSINNGKCWLISLFPWIYLIVHPLIEKITFEIGLGFWWKIFFQLSFAAIFYSVIFFQAVKNFKSINPTFNELQVKFIHWIFPGIFLYERAALIQATYDQRLPYLESMWWIWFLGMALMYLTALM